MSRYRLVPTPSRYKYCWGIARTPATCGNLAVEQQAWWRPGRGSAPGYVEQARQLTEARREFPWLVAGSVTVQQQALRDFGQAMANFFAGTHGRPTWRKAGRHEGFRQVGLKPRHVRRLSRKWGAVWVPKAGWVRFRLSRPVPAGMKSYRVTKDRAGRWHIAFAHIPDPIPQSGNGQVVGVDRGVKVSAALSTGRLLTVPGLTAGQARRLLLLQRRLARAKRGSNRRGCIKAAIARLKARETDRRTDWVEQTSTRLARDFDVIGVEDLNIRGMTRTARGTLERPGRRVAQKAGLNRGILAGGWGRLVERLEHKALGRIVKVNPAYTSQTCSVCGIRDAAARESQAVFACRSCGYTGHADVNAARNIKLQAQHAWTAAGRAVAAREGPGLPGPVNREPQHLLLPA